MSEWQPIDSAPKDGTQILTVTNGRGGRPYIAVTGWPVGWTGKWPTAYMALADGAEPTHWMPLPPPPTTE